MYCRDWKCLITASRKWVYLPLQLRQGGFREPMKIKRSAGKPRVAHVTTAHCADDVRIFERECRSQPASGRYDVHLAAAGSTPSDSAVMLISLESPLVAKAGRSSDRPCAGRGQATTRAVGRRLLGPWA